MIISHKYKFIFIKTTKTAGTSIEIYLQNYCGDDDIVTPIFPSEDLHKPRNYRGIFNPLPEMLSGGRESVKAVRDFFLFNRFYNHIYAKTIRARISSDIWRDYYKFCVERDPLDKTLSLYSMLNSRSNGTLTLDKYLQMNRFCINYPIYTDNNKNIIVDRILKYENLDQDLGEVFKLIGIPFEGSLNVKAKSTYRKDRKDPRLVFSKDQKKILAAAFKEECLMHGYTIL